MTSCVLFISCYQWRVAWLPSCPLYFIWLLANIWVCRDSSVIAAIATDWTTEVFMFISRQGQQTFMWSREARQATYVSRNAEAHLPNHFCTGKAINITYCECVFVALGTQHAMRMGLITVSSVACSILPYFPTLSPKWYNLREKVTEHKMCVLMLSTKFVWNISRYKKK